MFSTPFGLCLFIFSTMPTQIGYQDVSALIARQPAVAAHWRQHLRASAFGTIHAATFSFALPVGTSAPQPLSVQLANLDPRLVALTPWNPAPAEDDDPPLAFPKVDRSAKGDRQRVINPPSKPEAEKTTEPPPVAAVADEPEAQVVISPPAPLVEPEKAVAATESAAAEEKPASVEIVENLPEYVPDPLDTIVAKGGDAAAPVPSEQIVDLARVNPGHATLDVPREEPAEAAAAKPADPEIKVAALDPDIKLSALDPKQAPTDTKGGESIAPKGEVTGEGKRPTTPADRLKLEGKSRSAAEKCLADAIYFESRGEAVRGQIAVAQVVMNRVFSGYYPRSVCGTVYQNKHRRLACQFTFACDGIPDVVTEPHAWLRATRIARDVLDGKYWLPEVDRATHYHAYWVRPSWVREMKRLYKFGVHTFYRPRAWGDGADTPSWGTAEATREAIAKL